MFNLGRILAFLLRIKNDCFFFIPHLGVGGAEQVHLQTIDVFKKKLASILVITTKAPFCELGAEMMKRVPVLRLHVIEKNRWLFKFFLGFFSQTINQKKNKSVIFGSHSYFFYRLLPFLKVKSCVIDVIHSLEVGSTMRYGELFNAVNSQIDKVIAVDAITAHLIKCHSNRKDIEIITNSTDNVFFENHKLRSSCKPRLVFVGRYDPVKRPQIVEAIASHNPDFEVGWIGKIDSKQKKDGIIYHNLIKDRDRLASTMNHYDILIISSSTEAFPMVIQEAMALGMIVISTNVGGISTHIKNMENGLLVNSKYDASVLKEIEEKIKEVMANDELSARISHHAHLYAKKHFSTAIFEEKYLGLIEC